MTWFQGLAALAPSRVASPLALSSPADDAEFPGSAALYHELPLIFFWTKLDAFLSGLHSPHAHAPVLGTRVLV